MSVNIPRAIGLLEGLLGAIEITKGDVDINGVKKVLEEAVEILYKEVPELKEENDDTPVL